MKTLLLLLLLFSSTQAQNVWYIDRDATGSGNGTSWANAWTSLGGYWTGNPRGANWNIVQSGDTVYVSGGTDSTVYRAPQWIRQANAVNYNPRVSILPAWHEGHNGQVYFINEDSTETTLFRIHNVSGLYIKGFTFFTNFPVPVFGTGGRTNVYVGDGSSNVHIDSCIISSKNAGGALSLPGDFHTITNSTIETLHSNSVRDMDVFTFGFGRGGLTVRNCIIIQRNDAFETDAHRDLMQASGTLLDDDTLRTTFFENNFMWVIRPNAGGWNQGIYVHSGELRARQRWVFRNNLMIVDVANPWTGAFTIGSDDSTTMHSVHLYNNTFIVKGTPLTLRTIDTLVAKNNIFISTGDYYNGKRAMMLGRNNYHFNRIYKDLNYNHYYLKNWNSNILTFTNYNPTGAFEFNWGEWQALGLDVNSDTGYVNLADVRDSVISSYLTSTGRNGGIDLSFLFTNDLLGVQRPQGSGWDKGALEFVEGLSHYTNFQGKIFLQGPFNGNLMSTQLADSCSCIPLQQPYTTAPWNYAGNESIVFPNGQPGSGYIDWVLVELRSASNPVQVVGRRAAILRNDGRLLDTDGTPGVKFSNTNDGAYYVAIFHRNHLAVMSANPVQLSANSQLYDFTNSINKAYGNTPMADLGNGVFGMLSGDGDSNGGVTITDRNAVWQAQNGTVGYLKGDFNLNGGVNAQDANEFCTPNFGRMTQVP